MRLLMLRGNQESRALSAFQLHFLCLSVYLKDTAIFDSVFSQLRWVLPAQAS